MNAGQTLTKEPDHETYVAIRTMGLILLITLVAEFLTMVLLGVLGVLEQQSLTTAFLDALILSIVIAPPIYWLVLRPIRLEYQRRLQAETRAEDLSKLAITDALTRCMNRRGITMALLDAMAQAERYGTPLSVALGDIDNFKPINDQYGHEAGDKVLVNIASVLADSLRMPDKVGRYGGEEFLIVLPHTALAQGRRIAERVRAAVGNLRVLAPGGKRLPLTVSLGLTQFRKGEDLEQLLTRVDQALYDAKNAGRNRVAVRRGPAAR